MWPLAVFLGLGGGIVNISSGEGRARGAGGLLVSTEVSAHVDIFGELQASSSDEKDTVFHTYTALTVGLAYRR